MHNQRFRQLASAFQLRRAGFEVPTNLNDHYPRVIRYGVESYRNVVKYFSTLDEAKDFAKSYKYAPPSKVRVFSQIGSWQCNYNV